MIPELSLWFVRTDECPNNLRARLSPHRITIWNVCFTCLLACLLALLTHTHTHLLRTVIANSVVECILPAKTLLPLHLTGSRCYHRQSQCIWNQIVEETGSIWKKNRLLQQTCRPRQEIVETVKNAGWGSWLSPVPCLSKTGMTKMQVHQGDQPRLPPSCTASLACVCMMVACPLQIDMKLS